MIFFFKKNALKIKNISIRLKMFLKMLLNIYLNCV